MSSVGYLFSGTSDCATAPQQGCMRCHHVLESVLPHRAGMSRSGWRRLTFEIKIRQRPERQRAVIWLGGIFPVSVGPPFSLYKATGTDLAWFHTPRSRLSLRSTRDEFPDGDLRRVGHPTKET